ncbi:MAG: carotenoid biosynthesis protein [Actinobacteria bacterium]|nr:carotenoid biosynthesis protein [Actinomycetota bacterium]
MSGRQTDQAPVPGWTSRIPVVGLVATIGLQILWPLSSGQPRITLTIVTVIVFAATSVSHAWVHRGAAWALAYLGITFGFAFGLEAIGTNSGFPFGAYEYGDMLGIRIAEVPLLIPLAWAMTAYPVLLLSRRLAHKLGAGRAATYAAVVAIGAFAMTTWDLFLDPQMVSQGYWVWADPVPSLPGIDGIPAGNYAGWLLGSAVLMFLLNTLPNRPTTEAVPAALWTWTWVGGIISNAFFFGRPSVALVGGLAMAVVTIPYLYLLTTERGRVGPATTQHESDAPVDA